MGSVGNFITVRASIAISAEKFERWWQSFVKWETVMWYLNADNLFGTVPKSSQEPSEKPHGKKSDSGLVALEGIIGQDP